MRYRVSSELNADVFSVKVGDTIAALQISGEVASSVLDYDVNAGDKIVCTYIKDSSISSGEDMGELIIYQFKPEYVAVSTPNIATICKRMYVGVDNVARRIRKIYIGINNVAKKIFGLELTKYEGNIPALSSQREFYSNANIGDYTLFAGGSNNSTYYKTVDVYSKDLVKTTATELGYAVASNGSGCLPDYALFAGGRSSSSTYRAYVYAYNKSLTRSTASSLSSSVAYMFSESNGSYAFFAGGGTSSSVVSTVNWYSGSLTKSTGTSLSVARCDGACACKPSGSIICAGGLDKADKNSAVVDAYSDELVRTTLAALPVADFSNTGVRVSNGVVFRVGAEKNTSNWVFYSNNLVQTILSATGAEQYDSAIHFKECGIFASGYIVDKNLVVTTFEKESVGGMQCACGVVNDTYALIPIGSGGYMALIES